MSVPIGQHPRFRKKGHVAEFLGVDRSTLFRWRKRHDLPYLRLPSGRILYDIDELHAWLRKCRKEGTR